MTLPDDLDTNIEDQENRIFDSLVEQFPKTFKGKLGRDGVPRPDIYRDQRIRVLFVFREANSKENPVDWDSRKQVRDPWFGSPPRAAIWGWWNSKVARLGHAVEAALGNIERSTYAEFEKWILPGADGYRTHPFLWPFAFIQIKKVGGGGTSVHGEVEHHAREYAALLKEQIALYKPHLIIGCGRGTAAPAALLNAYVIDGGQSPGRIERTGRFKWWRFSDSARPVAMLQFNHPSARGFSGQQLHDDLYAAVRDIAVKAFADQPPGR